METEHTELEYGNESGEPMEAPLSPRDPPLWTRGVAIGLLLFASWWLFDTEPIRDLVGNSIGALCLGAIALSILQGMHLPLGVWPDGPWRKQFSVPAVIGVAIVLSAMILISKVASLDSFVEQLDFGTAVAVVGGTVALGFGLGMVKQRRYLKWYGIASLLGILPSACGFAVGAHFAQTELSSTMVLPSLIFLTAIGTASKLVTEEIAFRRLLIGVTDGSGLLIVLVSCLVSLAWYAILARSGIGGAGAVLIGTMGALSAGCLYVLSRSLVVSAIFSAVYSAGFSSIAVTSLAADTAGTLDGVSITMWIAAFVVCVGLAVVTVRKHGFVGNLRETASVNVTRN